MSRQSSISQLDSVEKIEADKLLKIIYSNLVLINIKVIDSI